MNGPLIRSSTPKPCGKHIKEYNAPCKGDMRFPLTHYTFCPYFAKSRMAK